MDKITGRMPATKISRLLEQFPFLTTLIDREQIASISVRRLTEDACEGHAGQTGGRYWFLTREGKVPERGFQWETRHSIDEHGEVPEGVAPSQVLHHMGKPGQVYYMIRFRAGEVVVYHAKHIKDMVGFSQAWTCMYEVLEGWDDGM